MPRFSSVLVFATILVGAGCSGDGESPTGAAVVKLRIDPGAAIILGSEDSAALSAIATDADGAEFTPGAVQWSSSSEDIVVDAQGMATTRSETASAWVTATVGSVVSEPILVVAAVTSDGVIPLEDARFVSEPEIVSDQVTTIDELRLQAVLSGPAPVVDSLVMATGAAAFGGRVVDVQPEGANNRVTVQGVAIETLFKELDVSIQRPWSTTAANAASLAKGIGHTRAGLNAGPFNCQTEAAVNPDLNLMLNPTLDTTQLSDSFIILVDNNGLSDFEMVTQGPLALNVDGFIEVPLALTAKIACTVRLFEAPLLPPQGVLSLINVEAYADFGVAFEAAANTVVARLRAQGAIDGTVRVGIDYDAISNDLVFLRDAEFEDNVDLSFDNVGDLTDESEVTIKPSMSLAVGSQLAVGKGASTITSTIGEWKGDSAATLSFATVKRQIADQNFAASRSREVTATYKISSNGMVLMSSWLTGLNTIVAVAAYFVEDVTLPSITLWSTKSANGSMTAPGSIAVGDTGEFVIDLQDVTEFTGYDIQEVQIIKHSGAGSQLTTQLAATLVPSADGQMQFTWPWAPTENDVGSNMFSAFVITNESPATPFEIENDSRQAVTVTKEAGGLILDEIRGYWELGCRAVIQSPDVIVDRDDRLIIDGEDRSQSVLEPRYERDERCDASITQGGATASSTNEVHFEQTTAVSNGLVSSFEFHPSMESTSTIQGWMGRPADHSVFASGDSRGSVVFSGQATEATPFTLTTSFEGEGHSVLTTGVSCGGINVRLTNTATTISGVIPAGGLCGVYSNFSFRADEVLRDENGTQTLRWAADVSLRFD